MIAECVLNDRARRGSCHVIDWGPLIGRLDGSHSEAHFIWVLFSSLMDV